jgi:hypothetical protein
MGLEAGCQKRRTKQTLLRTEAMIKKPTIWILDDRLKYHCAKVKIALDGGCPNTIGSTTNELIQ